MADYRLYLMNVRSGHIDSVRDLDAPDDLDAARRALEFAGRQPMELWRGGRKIHRYEALGADVACFASRARA